MATLNGYGEYIVSDMTRVADGAITAGHVVVKGTSAGEAKLPGAVTDVPYGVAVNNVADGENIRVATSGRVQVYAGAAVAEGAKVYIHGTDGEVDDVAQAGGAIGTALEPASGAGERILVDLHVGVGPFA